MTRDIKKDIDNLHYTLWTYKRKLQDMESNKKLMLADIGMIDWIKLQQLPEVPLRTFSKEMKVKEKPI